MPNIPYKQVQPLAVLASLHTEHISAYFHTWLQLELLCFFYVAVSEYYLCCKRLAANYKRYGQIRHTFVYDKNQVARKASSACAQLQFILLFMLSKTGS